MAETAIWAALVDENDDRGQVQGSIRADADVGIAAAELDGICFVNGGVNRAAQRGRAAVGPGPQLRAEGNSQPSASIAMVPSEPMEIEGSLLPWAVVSGTLLNVTVAFVVAAEASIGAAKSASTTKPASCVRTCMLEPPKIRALERGQNFREAAKILHLGLGAGSRSSPNRSSWSVGEISP